jgi:hypothetical protein
VRGRAGKHRAARHARRRERLSCAPQLGWLIDRLVPEVTLMVARSMFADRRRQMPLDALGVRAQRACAATSQVEPRSA